MQAIKTRFIGPTDKHWIKYRASCAAGSLTVDQDDNLNPEENHKRAARLLIRKLGWFHEEARGDRYGRWFQGMTKDGEYVHVCGVDDAEVKEEGPCDSNV